MTQINKNSLISALVILYQASSIDEHLSSEELNQIVSGMSRHLGTTDSQVGELIDVARLLAEDKNKALSYFEKLKNEASIEDRQNILTLIWRVFIVDNKVSKMESQFGKMSREKLGLTLEQAVAAGRKAEIEVAELRTIQAKKDLEEQHEE